MSDRNPVTAQRSSSSKRKSNELDMEKSVEPEPKRHSSSRSTSSGTSTSESKSTSMHKRRHIANDGECTESVIGKTCKLSISKNEKQHSSNPSLSSTGTSTSALESKTTDKRKRHHSSSSQNSDSERLNPSKSDNPKRSRLPVPKSKGYSSDAEELQTKKTQENPTKRSKPTPAKVTITPRIPDGVVTSETESIIPKESVRTPVEGETMKVNLGMESPTDRCKIEITEPDQKTADVATEEQEFSNRLTTRRDSKERRKSKRRSSFVIGRITRQAPASSELSENIPQDLPKEQRLAKLVEETLEYTFDKLHSEFGDELDGFQQLGTKSRCAVQETVENMTTLFIEATTKQRIAPNAVNERRRKEVEQLRADSAQLKHEIAEWENIVQQQVEEAQEAQQNYDDLPKYPITQEQCAFTRRQTAILTGGPDLDKMLQDLEDMKVTSVLALDCISQKVKQLSLFAGIAESQSQKYARVLRSKSFPQQTVDPKSLIENCLHFR